MVAMLGLSPSGSAFENGMNNAFGNTTIEQVAQMENPAQYIDNALNNIGIDATSVTDALATSSEMGTQFSSAAQSAGIDLPNNFSTTATAGQNIAAAADYYINGQQAGQVAQTIGGTALPTFDVTGILIGQWNQINKQHNKDIETINKLAEAGGLVNTNKTIADAIYSGGSLYTWTGSDARTFIVPRGAIGICYDTGNGSYRYYIFKGLSDSDSFTCYRNKRLETWTYNATWTGGYKYHNLSNFVGKYGTDGWIVVNDNNAVTQYIQQYVNNGQITNNKYSPDMITQDGNARATYNPSTNNYTVNYNPIINNDNRTTKYVTTIDWSDIEDWMQRARTNTEDNKTDEETQGEDYKVTIIREIVRDISQTNPENPDNDVTVPEYNPDFSTEDVIPVQPTEIPKPTLTPEEEEQNIDVTATAGLTEVFPFCIPWDIARLFGKFRMQREAPNLTFTLDLGPGGTHNIHIDFSQFDNVAALLRLLELIGFILGLMLVARKLIGD